MSKIVSINKQRAVGPYRSVLLVDDNEIDNFISKSIIEAAEFSEEVNVHTNAQSALEFLKTLEEGEHTHVPELLFLDINMPLIDGFEFLEAFAKLPDHITNKTKVVMLTTSVDPKDIERTYNNKFVIKYLSKPLTKEHLATIL